MTVQSLPGGTFTMAKDLTVTRVGYGAMQLAGPHVFGPPADRTPPWPFCARRSSGGSHTSTPPTSTARTSPTRSSRKGCTPIRPACTS